VRTQSPGGGAESCGLGLVSETNGLGPRGGQLSRHFGFWNLFGDPPLPAQPFELRLARTASPAHPHLQAANLSPPFPRSAVPTPFSLLQPLIFSPSRETPSQWLRLRQRQSLSTLSCRTAPSTPSRRFGTAQQRICQSLRFFVSPVSTLRSEK
jgi:hypothetical protein